MAQATVELRTLVERTNFDLFDFEYQFDDQQFKAQIEENILQFYYDYEIGFETPDMFKRKFKARWNRMIGYYNKLYNTTLLTYNPLTNYSISEALDQLATTNTTTDSTSDSTTNTNSDTTDNSHSFTDSNTKNSDYPQQTIAGGDFLNGESNTISDTTNDGTNKTIGKVTDNRTSNVTGVDTANTEYTKTIEGITGTTYQDLIQKQRETLLRITDDIIEEMKPCFMLVF